MPAQRPLLPVAPRSLEIVSVYPCPHCQAEVAMLAPTTATMARCEACRQTFPVMPVDERLVRYVKLMTAGGAAGVDPDFI